MTSTISVYACGGTGINQTKDYSKWNGKPVAGFATITTAFLDTSDSNFDELTPSNQCFQVMDIDTGLPLKGSGKDRSENIRHIEPAIPQILNQFPPGDHAIIIHSTTGGTGNVIGFLLAQELSKRGISVIVLGSGGTSSKAEIRNTIFVAKTLQNEVEESGVPINIFYREQTATVTRKQVDTQIQTALHVFLAMLSGDNKELDRQDCHNFLNYCKVIKMPAKLGYLDIFEETVEIDKNQLLISMLSVGDEDSNMVSSNPVEYHATGFLNPAAREGLTNLKLPLHATISSGFMATLESRLNKSMDEFAKARELVVDKKVSVAGAQKSSKGVMFD